MKRVQPYQYIVFMAFILIVAGLVLFTLQHLRPVEGSSATVDPLTQAPGGDLYDLWFTRVALYDISIDHNLTSILFSADNNKISLLDRERKLRWDKVFATAPVQAKISSCGNYVAVGTAGGRLHFSRTDQKYFWDDEGAPVYLLAMSPNGQWVAAARSIDSQDKYYLELYSQVGELQWTLETGPLTGLFLSSEYLEQTNIYYTSLAGEQPRITAVGLDGSELWAKENQRLAAVSRHGSRIAAVNGRRLIVYDALGYELWSTNLPIEAEAVLFNPQNYNRILVFGSRDEVGENLFYFDLAEDLLWMKNIEDGSLLAFTADGRHIVTSSWRHYKEDFTQMKLLDQDGIDVNSWEVAMRVEQLLIAGHPTLVVIGGDDGYIDLVDLKPLISANGNGIASAPLYSPVLAGLPADETRVTLYFSDENSNLIPVTRTVSLTDYPIQAAMDELVRGPARGSALYRTIPDKNATIAAHYDPATRRLNLDLSSHFLQLDGEAQSQVAFQAIVRTASANAGVKEIYLTVGGEPLEKLGQIVVEQPVAAFKWEQPLFVPVYSGDRYYLIGQEAEWDSQKEISLKDQLGQLLRIARGTLPFIPADLTVLEVRVADEQIFIDMNQSFKELFADDAGDKEVLQVALLLDALFLTVFKNSRAQRAEILVAGESWLPPLAYPSLGRFYRQPCFLNPEH